MSASIKGDCPECGAIATFAFFKKRGKYVCSECEAEFDEAPKPPIDPQTIFLSYAHKSEREEDFDVSEELVLLIKSELDKDGHTVWIDKEGIRSGSQWRERITSAILEHAHFLSFLSRRSVRDPGVCLNEIATALGSKRNIQTVLAGPEHEVAAPLTISHLQWHDFQDWREIRSGTKTGPTGEEWDAWFAQRMALVREAVGNAQNARVSGQLQRLKDILVPSEFEARIIDKTKGFYGRQWLFDATQSWLDNSTTRMFWLKASPGIGKSAFAAKLTHQARSAVIGFFMCDFQGKKDPEESAREAICTLAFQMASRLPDYRVKLIHQQQVDKEKILKKSADDLFEYLITEPLNKSGKIPESTRLCLVIDGLDEAGRSDHGNALAELLVKHVDRLPEWLGVIVTSRPEPYLEQILKPLSGISVDGQTEQNRQDLVAWIGEKLPDQIIGEERQRIINAVIDKSGGTFLYLRLIEEDKTLDISKPETLPDKLDGIFKQNFNRYFPDPQEYGNKTEPFLRLMVAAPGPLPAQMGRQILGWSQRDLTLKVTEPLGSLLQERDGGLVFFHASLADWLNDPKRSGTHCVNDTGARELGEFVWSQFEDFDNSEWKQQVVSWLARLMPQTEHWHEVKELNRAAEFLGEQLRHRDAISVRQRELERITQTLGADGVEAAECTQSLGTALKLIGDSTGALGQFRAEFAIRERLVTQDPDNAGWQRELGVSYNRIGGILESQGNLPGALAQQHKYQKIMEHLVAQDPNNSDWQRELGVSHNRIGGILKPQGKLTGALAQFHKFLAISERLAAQDPDNSDWQRGLGASYNCIGGVLEAQGKLTGALAQFHKDLVISERLAAQDPDNAGWQSSLSDTYSVIGRILERQGNLAEALTEYRKALSISERLVALDPDNAGWQRNLGASYGTIGGILQAQGDLSGALVEFRKDLAICERLVALDPDNERWQIDRAVVHNHIGDIFEEQCDLEAALAEFRKDMAIIERLESQDPGNVVVQRGLGIGCRRIGDILGAKGDLIGALAELRKALMISERLAAQDPGDVPDGRHDYRHSDHAGWQHELGAVHHSVGDTLKAQGDLVGALAQYLSALAIIERLALVEPDNSSWQRDLSSTYSKIGRFLKSQGDLAGALVEYRKAHAIRERLAEQDPDNADWQRDLALSHNRIGRILEEQGDLEAANEEYSKDLAVSERLAAQDPDNSDLQSDLSVTHRCIGDILKAQGDQVGALGEYRKDQAIRERLAEQDPDNADWQRDLSLSCNRIGGVLEKQGDLEAALVEYRKDLAISEALAARDLNNADWQCDLGVTHRCIGDILRAQSDLTGAIAEFQNDKAIRDHLTRLDPDNTDLQRVLGASCIRLGGVIEMRGDLPDALVEYRQDKSIREHLAARDPENVDWQRDLALSHNRVGGILEAQGDIFAAQFEFVTSLVLFEKLRDPDDVGSMVDHAASLARLAQCHDVIGEVEAALALDLQIAEIDWTPDAIVGGFRKKSIPKIVARLDAVFDHCPVEIQAAIVIRCIASLDSSDTGGIAKWCDRGRQLLSLLPSDHPLAGRLGSILRKEFQCSQLQDS